MGLCLRDSVYCNGTVECPDASDEPSNCRSKCFRSSYLKSIISFFLTDEVKQVVCTFVFHSRLLILAGSLPILQQSLYIGVLLLGILMYFVLE